MVNYLFCDHVDTDSNPISCTKYANVSLLIYAFLIHILAQFTNNLTTVDYRTISECKECYGLTFNSVKYNVKKIIPFINEFTITFIGNSVVLHTWLNITIQLTVFT